MDFQTLDLASLSALADIHAARLARAAITDVELRDALQTSVSSNGVRIGGCEISYRVVNDERVFDITYEDGMIVGVAFYETARYMVSLINQGQRPKHREFGQLVNANAQYVRARDAAYYHSERSRHYREIGDDFRADLNESKYSRDAARARFLRDRLLQCSHFAY